MRKLSDSLISLDRIVSLGQIGLLARVGRTKIRTVCQCALAERYALLMQIVIPASCPKQINTFDRDSRNRRGSTSLRSSLGPHPATAGPISLAQSLAGYNSPASVQLTPKALFHLVSSRSDSRDRPWASCCLVPR